MSESNSSQADLPNRRFATTHWSMIRSVGSNDSKIAKSALEELCEIYWYPLYAFVRHQGHQAQTAADLTQGFFASLLGRDDLNHVSPEHGKFRSFLIASLKNFIRNEWNKANAQKRGGGHQIFSMDFQDADERFKMEPAHAETSDHIFEKQWALTLIGRAQKSLAKYFESIGKSHQFKCMQVFLAGKAEETNIAEVAGKLGMTEVALKVAIHRMRQKFGELLRKEIEKTVDSPTDVEAEIAELFKVLSQNK